MSMVHGLPATIFMLTGLLVAANSLATTLA